MRFLGNIEAKTDAKGRAFLPAVFRKMLQASGSESLVLRKDIFQDCLVLYHAAGKVEQIQRPAPENIPSIRVGGRDDGTRWKRTIPDT